MKSYLPESHATDESQGLKSQMGYARILATALLMAALLVCGAVYAQQADAASGFGVGDVLPAAEIHIISKPGLYGLGPDPANSKYAIAHGKLIRVNPNTRKVLSILRSQNEVLD